MNFTVLRSTGQGISRISLNWNCSHLFLMIRFGLWVLQKTTEVKFHLHYITARVYTINMTYHCWFLTLTPSWDSGLSGFSSVKSLFSLFSLWKKVIILSSYLSHGKSCYTYLRVEYLYNYLEFHTGDFPMPSLFKNLFNC